MIRIGSYEIRSIVNGYIRLDGGAMFGVVPKTLWSQRTDADPLNRILLATRTLLAVNRERDRIILVDTGCGTKWKPENLERFGVEPNPEAISTALAELGCSTNDVTDVVITHLHFDHNGGLTDWVDNPDGPTRLCYPQARHWIHRKHWEHANRPHVKDQASFIQADFDALARADVLCFVDGEEPGGPFPEVSWFISHGHTPYQLHPFFHEAGSGLIFIGDLVPTMAHLRLAWVMAYDALPMVTIDEKKLLLKRCIDENLIIAFPHDPEAGGVRIDGQVSRVIVTEKISL